MAKATFELPDGTKVRIEGSAQEIKNILAHYADTSAETKTKTRKTGGTKANNTTSSSVGPTSLILELKDEGFFKEKRRLKDIQVKLEEKGFIYAVTSLSPALTKMTRRKHLRRLKEKVGWVYVSN